MINWEEFNYERTRKQAEYRAKALRSKKCYICGLHGCICQISLKEFMEG